MSEYVTLVDAKGNPIKSAEKQFAHEQGLRHSAFSIVLFDNLSTSFLMPWHDTCQILLQKRQGNKYHSASCWSNACCGHPRFEESVLDAAQRRLSEELGISLQLHAIGTTQYRLNVGSGLVENEWNHIFWGYLSRKIPLTPNPLEISDLKWVAYGDLKKDLAQHPHVYSAWLPFVLEKFYNPLII